VSGPSRFHVHGMRRGDTLGVLGVQARTRTTAICPAKRISHKKRSSSATDHFAEVHVPWSSCSQLADAVSDVYALVEPP